MGAAPYLHCFLILPKAFDSGFPELSRIKPGEIWTCTTWSFSSQIKCSGWYGTLGADNFSKARKNRNKKTTNERCVVALLLEDFM